MAETDPATRLTTSARRGAVVGESSRPNSAPVANPALDRLARLAAHVLDVPVALVSLVEEDRQVFPGCVGLREPWGSRRETPISHSFCKHVVATQTSLVIEDARAHALVIDNPAIHDLGVVAYAGMPLATPEGHVLGSFCAIDSQPRTWSDRDLDILREFAAAAATEIELDRQVRSAEAAKEMLATVNHVGRTLNADLDLDRIMATVTEAATGLTGAAFGALFYNVTDERGDSYALYTLAGAPKEAFADFPLPRSTPIFGPTFRGEGPVRLDDVRTDPRYGQLAPHYGLPPGHLPVASYLAVPIVTRSGEVLGGLFFGHPDTGVFGEQAEELARGLAAHAAIAIENARLFERAQGAEARYRALFSGVADAILVVDAHGTIRDANPAAANLLGYAPDELLHIDIADTLVPDEHWLEEEYPQLARDGSWRGELGLQARDGTRVPAEAWVTSVDIPGGPVYVSSIRDVTSRRAMETAQQAFLADVSHDLKNPLAALKGQAQLMRRRAGRMESPDGERLDAGFEQIMALVDRMAGQIEELVDVARLRTGQPLQLRPETTDFVEFVRQTTLMHEETSPQHAVRFKTALHSLVGQCDSVRMARVLDNLISNAVKYSPDGGTVTVTLRHEHGDSAEHAIIEVRDEGIGIPAADLPHIFERFRRGGNVTEQIIGSGIGLAGARQIVEQHGGQTSIDSREGQGTTITVRLPLMPISPIA